MSCPQVASGTGPPPCPTMAITPVQSKTAPSGVLITNNGYTAVMSFAQDWSRAVWEWVAGIKIASLPAGNATRTGFEFLIAMVRAGSLPDKLTIGSHIGSYWTDPPNLATYIPPKVVTYPGGTVDNPEGEPVPYVPTSPTISGALPPAPSEPTTQGKTVAIDATLTKVASTEAQKTQSRTDIMNDGFQGSFAGIEKQPQTATKSAESSPTSVTADAMKMGLYLLGALIVIGVVVAIARRK